MKISEKLGLFAGGVLFGTAGIKILTSKDAKKVYTHATAAVLRAKDCVMEPSPGPGRTAVTSTPTPRTSTRLATPSLRP